MPPPKKFLKPRPRRFEKVRRNEEIRAPRINLVDAEGKMHTAIPTREALRMARDARLDLVEVQENRAGAPLCKIIDYGKFRYETKKLANKRKKESASVEDKELHFSVRAAAGDVETVLTKAAKFLEKKHRVQLQIRMRGREQAHLPLAGKKLWTAAESLAELGCPDNLPKKIGRSLQILVRPGKMPDRWQQFRERIEALGAPLEPIKPAAKK